MQAVILSAGASSRFYPLNRVPKSLIKIAGEPIIVHTIRSIKRAGITDIVLLTGPKNHFQEVIGTGKKFGVKITYARLSEPTGMGNGILACLPFIKSDFFLVNPQQISFEELKKDIDEKRGTNQNVVLLAKDSPNKNYGALKVSGDRVLSVVEKPGPDLSGLSNLRIIGVYFITFDFLKTLKKETPSHYSFEAALNTFAKKGKVRVAVTDKNVLTLKYPWDLLDIKNFILSRIRRSISKSASISKHAVIEGNVVIEEGAIISEMACIKGPAYIGKNVFVGTNALVRNGSSIEDNSVVGAYMEVKNSLIMRDSKTHSGHLEDSVVGENSRLGALFTSANVKLDRSNVVSIVKGESIDTGMRSFGVIIGSNTMIGSRVTTMPGVIIGNNVNIGPSTTVMKNIDSDTIYYAKFSEFVEKNKSQNTLSVKKPAPRKKR